MLDTGLRLSEALGLRESDIDADNLILKVFGKGQKERLVPFSPELRKRLPAQPAPTTLVRWADVDCFCQRSPETA